MLCQNCNKRTATVHWTKIVNNKKKEVHLCEVCAQDSEQLDFDIDSGFSLQNFLTGLMNFGQEGEEGKGKPKGMQIPKQNIQCDTCDLTYQQFAKMGRFGCSNCYEIFGEYLKPMLKRIHGSTNHSGKVPKRAGSTLRVKKQVSDLKEKLQSCIYREEYERAAEIRDEIKRLEQELEE